MKLTFPNSLPEAEGDAPEMNFVAKPSRTRFAVALFVTVNHI